MVDYWNKHTLILGCGNILFGDDGFGPAVAEHFERNFKIPDGTCVINAGLSVRDILFNLILAEKQPKKIIIVDAIDAGKKAGEIFELKISDIPPKKTDDFSMHQQPTSNLLRELAEFCDVDIKIICVQVVHIPDEVSPGLSKPVQKSIPKACWEILRLLD